MLRTSKLLLVLHLSVQALGQTHSQRAAVQLNATVVSSPSRITLSWVPLPNTTSITIYRKLATASSWGSAVATASASATQYQDNSVGVGVSYEYRVVRNAGGTTGQGYIASGIEVPLEDYKGKLVLLVDNTMSGPLASELAQLTNDLRADGWVVLRSDVSRTASVTSIRNTVINHYNSDPTHVKALFLFGHVPVPYSGNINPDGHSAHRGAWPCDGYYGDINGVWTDVTVYNTGAERVENRNVPGDGKFDQSTFPSALELQVGRVDMYDMPAFALSETELLRAYLVKLHTYKVAQWTPTPRGVIFDNLFYSSSPLAGSAWRSMAPLMNASDISVPNVYAGNFVNLIHGQSYLWTYNSGGGLRAYEGSVLTFNGADLVGTTQTYASTNPGGVFNMSLGSYYGDWDNRNNFLRAPLAKGAGLTNCWAGLPAWYFHHMGQGQNIGYSALKSMNNTGTYTPVNDGWQGSLGATHLALMGDPSLRLKMIAPPSDLMVTNAGGAAAFSWTASPTSVVGYHIYRFDGPQGPIQRLTTTPVEGTTYSHASIPFAAGTEYMVRAVKLQVEPSGSYYNLSLGAIGTTSGSASADCLGVPGGAALPGTACNDGNPCTTNDVWNADCQCAGTNTALVATITANGPTAFCTGGSVVLNANTGSGYTYAWKRNGTTIGSATASSYTATQAGSYTVVVSSGGCSMTSSAQTVTVGAEPVAVLTAGGPTTFCSGGSVALVASTATGYTYVWKRNGTTISGAGGSTYTATQAGSYVVTVSDNGCAVNSSALLVTVNALPVASCTSGPSDGTVSVSASGGEAPYSYSWNTIPAQSSATATVTSAGTYTVIVTDMVGCSITCTTTIPLPSPDGCDGIRTESQTTWSAPASANNAAAFMYSHFEAAFPAPHYLRIGLGDNKVRLTSAAAVSAFLPSVGNVEQFPLGTMVDPGTSYGNPFAGELVALKLAVRFDELMSSFSSSTVLLKDMVIASGTFAGWTVEQLVLHSDVKIGEYACSHDEHELHAAMAAVNEGYVGGTMNSGYLVCPGSQGMVLQSQICEHGAVPEEAMVVTVFPNPASNLANMVMNGTSEGHRTWIEVYSLNGELVHTADLGTLDGNIEQRYAVDVSSMVPGIYFYKVMSGDRVAAGRIVVQQ